MTKKRDFSILFAYFAVEGALMSSSPDASALESRRDSNEARLDVISVQETVAFIRRFAPLASLTSVLGALLGALYWWQTGGVHYESFVGMGFEKAQAMGHLEDPAAINEALVRAFSDTEIAQAFAADFIATLGKGETQGSESIERLRALLYRSSADLTDSKAATDWLASYSQDQLVDIIQGQATPPNSGFYLAFTVPRRERIELSFRSYSNGIAANVVEAASSALNTLVKLYNDNMEATSRARLKRQHDEMAAAYDAMSERFFKEKEEVDKQATLLATNFTKLEAELDAKQGKSSRDSNSAKTVFQLFGDNQDTIFMFRSLFNVPSTSSSDVVDTFNAMRFKGFAERLVKAKQTSSPTDQQFYTDALIELEKIEHGNAILMARMKPQLQALDGMRVALSAALEALVKPLDGRDFALPTVRVDLEGSRRHLERRGRGVSRSVVVGALIGFFAAATIGLIAQAIRRKP